MREKNQSRLASALLFLLGAWLLLSPIFISISGAALVSLMIVGGVIAACGIVQYFWENSTPSWIAAAAGAYLFITAYTFTVSNAVIWNQVLSAIGAVIFAAWDGTEATELRRLHHGPGHPA